MADRIAQSVAKKLYGDDAPEFPTVERYEVHEVHYDGTTSGHARGTAYYQSAARDMAERWTREAQERYAVESGGPVKPSPPSRFVVVKVTETREVV